MDVIFTDLFVETCEREFRVYRKQVRQAVNDPTCVQVETFDDLELGFFVKEDDDAKENPTSLLVCARKVDEQWVIDLAFRVPVGTTHEPQPLEPLQLLQQLVESFGCEIRIGAHRGKFVFRKTFPISPVEDLHQESAEVLDSVDQGLLHSLARIQHREDGTFVECALVFCIDTGRYISWLFGWDDQQLASVKPYTQDSEGIDLLLTDEDKESIRERVRAIFPNDEQALYEASLYRGACILLKRAFGEAWYDENIRPRIDDGHTFLRRPMSDPLERQLQVTRTVELAEALYTLRDVPGVSERVDAVKGHTLESLWFEFFVPHLIQDSGHRIMEFVPESAEERRPDLIIDFLGELIPVEIKAKAEESAYSRRGLLNLLNKGFSQLPESGPGVIFLMVHSRWLQDAQFLKEAEPTIRQALRRNRNCNAIFVFWPQMGQIPTGQFMYQWRFQHFACWHPMQTVRNITDLLEEKEGELKPVSFTFLE